jgi:hypothetical protein
MQIVDTSAAERVVELDPAGIVLLNFRWREPNGWTRWLWEDEAGGPIYEMAPAEDASGLIRTVDRLECQGVLGKDQAEAARLGIRAAVFSWMFGHRLQQPVAALWVDRQGRPQVLGMQSSIDGATGGGLGVTGRSVGDSPSTRVGQSDPPSGVCLTGSPEPLWWWVMFCWASASAAAFAWAIWG